jgi:hypothetical protein
MATFHMQSRMKLAARPGILLVGEIKSGTIRAGMVARVSVDGGLYTEAPIVGVEFVDGARGKSQLALHIAFDDPRDEEIIEALCGDGDTIEIVEPNDGAIK